MNQSVAFIVGIFAGMVLADTFGAGWLIVLAGFVIGFGFYQLKGNTNE